MDEVAVISNMGAPSRRPEARSLSRALSQDRPLKFLTEPATLDGGDVLRADRRLFVGLSQRTNQEGADQLSDLLESYDYQVQSVKLIHFSILRAPVPTSATKMAVGKSRLDRSRAAERI